MTPFDHFKKFYGEKADNILHHYMDCHYVYCSQNVIVLAKPEDGCWWIEYLAGDVKEAFSHLPFWLQYISFSVKGRHKCYTTAKLVNRFLPHDTIKI